MISCYCREGEFLEELSSIDAVFPDIDMPRMSGLEIAEYINQNHPVPILFLTAHDELVYSSFQFQPFRFIRKGYIDSELEEAVRALNDYIIAQSRNHSVCLHTSEGDISISVKDIAYAEIYGHWIKIHPKEGGTFDCYGSLSDYERQWDKYGFVRTHKSYLVNVRYIYSILKDTVVLDGGERVLLGRNRVRKVREKFEMMMRCI